MYSAQLSKNLKNRRFWLPSLFLIWFLLGGNNAARINRAAFMDDATVRSEVVDPNNRTIWHMFNLTQAQVNLIQEGTKPQDKEANTLSNNTELLNRIRDQRMNEIRSTIEKAVSNKSEDGKDLQGNGNQDVPQHEVAGYPVCNAEADALTWQHSNNVTLLFSSSVFERNSRNVHVDSAILRLYKKNPKANGMVEQQDKEEKTTTACTDTLLESQIRVTVSIVHQLRKKQRKKRICNTMMLSTTKTGWVDIDIKCAIQYWEQQQQQPQQPPIMVGLLMIEVHDDEENQLKPGQYFLPPTCEQAGTAVPWSVYRPKTLMSNTEENDMPKSPRLDILLIGYGAFAPKNFDFETNRRIIENAKRQLHILPKSSEHISIESTTSNSPTVDNLLDNSGNESQEKPVIHQHRKRHYHSQTERTELPTASTNSEDASDSSSSNSSSAQLEPHNAHHRSRNNHHHHHHHNHHHKHRHSKHQQDQMATQ